MKANEKLMQTSTAWHFSTIISGRNNNIYMIFYKNSSFIKKKKERKQAVVNFEWVDTTCPALWISALKFYLIEATNTRQSKLEPFVFVMKAPILF